MEGCVQEMKLCMWTLSRYSVRLTTMWCSWWARLQLMAVSLSVSGDVFLHKVICRVSWECKGTRRYIMFTWNLYILWDLRFLWWYKFILCCEFWQIAGQARPCQCLVTGLALQRPRFLNLQTYLWMRCWQIVSRRLLICMKAVMTLFTHLILGLRFLH